MDYAQDPLTRALLALDRAIRRAASRVFGLRP
jgi:hypothetical protein